MADLIFVIPGSYPALQMLQQALPAEIEARVLATGNDALWELQRVHPALVIADVDLPGMSGLDLAELVPNFAPHTKVVLCARSASNTVRQRADSLGVRELVVGEQTAEALRTLVLTVLGRLEPTAPAAPETPPAAEQRPTRETRPAAEARPAEQRPAPAAPAPRPPEPAKPRPAAASTRPSMRHADASLVLTEQTLSPIRARMQTLAGELGPQVLILSDRMGAPLVEIGRMEGVSMMVLLPLLSACFSTANELKHQLREEDGGTLYFHEGSRYDIYAFQVGASFVLTLVFEKNIAPSKIGPVWVYTKRAIKDLLDVLE